MATLTLLCIDDAFNNNISGFYPSEDFVTIGATSSSNAIENDGLWRFPAAGLAAGDTINSVTFYYYCTAANDGNNVATLVLWTDVNDLWGTLDNSDPPSVVISTGTVMGGQVGVVTIAVNAWNSLAAANSIPKNAAFNIGITCDLGDIGPANVNMDAIENTNARSPYPAGSGQTDGRAFIVIDYTPASDDATPQRTLVGVGT